MTTAKDWKYISESACECRTDTAGFALDEISFKSKTGSLP